MKFYKLLSLSLLTASLLTNCQSSTNSGDGAPTSIPAVQVNCTSSNCQSASGSKHIFIYVTTSGCVNSGYGLVATGTGNINCSASGCASNSAMTWTYNGTIITQIPSNTYDYCSFIDITGSYPAISTGDASSSQSGESVGTSANPVSSISVTNWINGNFMN